MVEEVVVDASVLVAAFLEHDERHEEAASYLEHLHAGSYQFHLPHLALVETCAAINRQAPSHSYALAIRAKVSLETWETQKKIVFYDLDRAHAQLALNVALRDRLRGSDSIYAALAQQKDIPLRSYDIDHLTRFRGKLSR